MGCGKTVEINNTNKGMGFFLENRYFIKETHKQINYGRKKGSSKN